MADFCYDCTDNYIDPKYASQNDFVSEYEFIVRLCEGCGLHFFNKAGVRVHDWAEGDPMGVSALEDEGCDLCRNFNAEHPYERVKSP